MKKLFTRKSKTASSAMAEDSPEESECLSVWGLSLDEENSLLAQLRDEIELEAGKLAPEFDDHALRRFLRARKHHILKAKVMFLDQLKWRKEEAVDTILTDFVFHEHEEFAKWYPEGFYGVDREGRPVYVQRPGKIDTVELWKFTTMERCIRHHLQQQERYWRIVAPACSLVAGRLHEQSLVIIDMDGVGISTLTGEVRKIMGVILQIDQDYFPELMWRCVIINAPTTFRVIWSMIKYLLDARTQDKIEVLGSDYLDRVQALIAPDQLMQAFGGTNPTPLGVGSGPWLDPAVLSRLEQQRQQRLLELGVPASMTFPAVTANVTT